MHHKKPRLRDRTDRAWFSRFLQHPARKWSRSILTTLEPDHRFDSWPLRFHVLTTSKLSNSRASDTKQYNLVLVHYYYYYY